MIYSTVRGFLSPDVAFVPIQDSCFQFGAGLFETMRTYGEKHLFLAEEHIDRLFAGAAQIGLNLGLSKPKLLQELLRVVEESHEKIQRVKMIATASEILILSVPLKEPKEVKPGVRLKSVNLVRSLPHLKSCSYLDAIHAYEAAQRAGYDEAILYDDQGYATEGSRSNFFWVSKGELFTNTDKALAGITQSFLMEKGPIPVTKCRVTLEELKKADELMITNSIIGIRAALSLDEHNWPQPGMITNKLIHFYQSSCQNL